MCFEIDEMRRHVQQLQEQLNQFVNQDHNDKEVYQFLHRPHHDLSDDSSSQH